ncbi:hypothetical protein ACYEXT_01540 [Microbacterium sp. MAH-37]
MTVVLSVLPGWRLPWWLVIHSGRSSGIRMTKTREKFGWISFFVTESLA